MDFQTAMQLFSYDPETGEIRWRVDRSPRVRAGHLAGGRNCDGYVHVGFQRRLFKAHRLAWLLHTGEWPAKEIDHINGVRHDNRIANLRDVSHAVNQLNQRAHRAGAA